VDISIKTNGGLELKIVLSIKNDEEPFFTLRVEVPFPDTKQKG
jgi:hypothetical protein